MGLGKLQQQHKRHQERLAEERRRAVEKIQRENEALRALARQIQEARKARDRQAALRLGETLTTLARTRCKDVLDDDASLAGLWVASGERYLPRRTRSTDTASPLGILPTTDGTDPETTPEPSDGLPSIDALFNGGGLRS